MNGAQFEGDEDGVDGWATGLGQDRKVLFAEAHADFRVRPEPNEALGAVMAASRR